jgi:pantetheine-phosphate adenylyltransferase
MLNEQLREIGMAQLDRRLHLVSVGGTFDVFHKGHSLLLEEAFKVGNRVIVGLSTDEFANSLYKSHTIDCYAKREKDLIRFLAERGLEKRAEILPLKNAFGPTIESDEMEGIVVSEETESGALEINRRRVKEGKRPLLIVVFKMILAQDGKPISSTRIRRQEVDRFGRLIG